MFVLNSRASNLKDYPFNTEYWRWRSSLHVAEIRETNLVLCHISSAVHYIRAHSACCRNKIILENHWNFLLWAHEINSSQIQMLSASTYTSSLKYDMSFITSFLCCGYYYSNTRNTTVPLSYIIKGTNKAPVRGRSSNTHAQPVYTNNK
jgi:hypothetical protein